ncbi:MAG: hypothetical protein OQL17_01100 [Sedimenticola sp.]|nr:hypothetical protein [Sedimenticola sp.]
MFHHIQAQLPYTSATIQDDTITRIGYHINACGVATVTYCVWSG